MIDSHSTRLLWKLLERHYGVRRQLESLDASVDKSGRYSPESARVMAGAGRRYVQLMELASLKEFEEEELLTCLGGPLRGRVLMAKPHISGSLRTLKLMADALAKSGAALEEGRREAHESSLGLCREFSRMLGHLIDLQDEMVSDILESMLRPEQSGAAASAPGQRPLAAGDS